MKKLSLVLAAMIAASSISFYGTAAFAEETGLDYDGSVNVAFGNTTGKRIYIRPQLRLRLRQKTRTLRLNRLRTQMPRLNQQQRLPKNRRRRSLLMRLEPEHRKLMLLRCQYCYIIIYRMILTAQMRYLLSHQEIFVCI